MTPGADPPIRIALSGRTLLLVAGLPGAGKSTLLGNLRCPGGEPVAVLDSDPVRIALARRLPASLAYHHYRPLVHLWHRLRIVLYAVAGPRTVVVHLPATAASTRAVLAALAACTARRAELFWLEASRADARLGQRSRGRELTDRGFSRHVARGVVFAARLRAGRVPLGWDAASVWDRSATRRGVSLEPTARRTAAAPSRRPRLGSGEKVRPPQ